MANTAQEINKETYHMSEKSTSKQEYQGYVKSVSILNKAGANKETYHIEIEGNTPINYQPGDIVGFTPENPQAELQAVAQWLNSPEVADLLLYKNIRRLIKSTINQLNTLLGISIEEDRMDLVDIVKKYPVTQPVDLQAFVALFKPITPRLYSISSSPNVHTNSLHVTVTLNTFEVDGQKKYGLASYYLGHLSPQTPISFFIQKKDHFKLPSPQTDIIMIGPGVGVAPFKGFLEQRSYEKATGRSWLFFGEQHQATDFYYQDLLEQWTKEGTLTKLSTAFSRDQSYKIYVQDRIREHQQEFVSWVDNGAYIYICGQRKPMSIDVEQAIIDAFVHEKGCDTDEAKQLLKQLAKEGRYAKDVY